MRPVKLFAASLAAAALATTAATSLGQSGDADIRLEGSGMHRDEMNATQLKPFDPAFWANLTNWSGTPVTPEMVRDKVVLLVTWTSYAKNVNNPAAILAERMHKQYADKGLIVVGIHNPKGFDTAASVAKELGLTFAYAADEQGKARTMLKVDQDPDFFLIDRAGNMRFADIDTASVAQAVALATGETTEVAAAVPGAVAKSAADRQRELMKSRDVKGGIQPGMPLTVPFVPPAEESYARAKWPGVISKSGVSEFDQLASRVIKERPAITLNDEGWLTPRPAATGRVTLVYQLDPLDSEVSDIPLKMARLQDAFPRDLTVVGNVFGNDEGGNLTEEEKAERKQRRINSIKELLRQRALNHGFNAEPIKVADGSSNKIVVPVSSRHHFSIAYLISSDGRCRWVGNQFWDGFDTVVSDFIDADPGVKVRRKAEEAAAKATGN